MGTRQQRCMIHAMAATPSAGHYILSYPPTYDGIGTNEYIEWEVAIDNIFSQCRMCEYRKIKNASSVLTDNALVWWDNLCELINLDPGMT